MNLNKLTCAVLLALGTNAALAAPTPVDLGTWSAQSYPAVSGFGAGVWTVAPGGGSVFQSVNGQPTLFHSDFSAFGTKITGKIKVETTGDDDYIGFALGYRPNDTTNSAANYLLVDWKQSTQNFNFGTPSASGGGISSAGLAVSRVTGIPDADELWQHMNLAGTGAESGVEELARGTNLGNVGWSDNTEYEFSFDFGPNDLEVYVNGVKELDITGSFQNGRIAFYNFSQSDVRYSAFELDEGSFPPPPTTSVSEPGVLALLACSLFGVRVARRRS